MFTLIYDGNAEATQTPINTTGIVSTDFTSGGTNTGFLTLLSDSTNDGIDLKMTVWSSATNSSVATLHAMSDVRLTNSSSCLFVVRRHGGLHGHYCHGGRRYDHQLARRHRRNSLHRSRQQRPRAFFGDRLRRPRPGGLLRVPCLETAWIRIEKLDRIVGLVWGEKPLSPDCKLINNKVRVDSGADFFIAVGRTATVGLTAAKVLSDALIANLILLEGQGYVLAIPDAYVQGRRFLSPGQISTVNYWQGYGAGFKGRFEFTR